jgi:hypothetical protein
MTCSDKLGHVINMALDVVHSPLPHPVRLTPFVLSRPIDDFTRFCANQKLGVYLRYLRYPPMTPDELEPGRTDPR